MLRYAPLLALVALPAAAQPGALPAGTYQVDAAHTQVLYTVDHLGISPYTGAFNNPTGTLTIDPRRPGMATVDIRFPLATAIQSTVQGLTDHLMKADFFDVANHPEARFVSTRVVANGQRATITGNLTLRGVTRPVVLQARLTGAKRHPMSKKPNIGFTATTSVMRSAFGINYGIPMVSDRVDLVINAAFEKQ